jgi:hypothetical protein
MFRLLVPWLVLLFPCASAKSKFNLTRTCGDNAPLMVAARRRTTDAWTVNASLDPANNKALIQFARPRAVDGTVILTVATWTYVPRFVFWNWRQH